MKIEPNAFVVVKSDIEENKSEEIFPEGRSTHDVASDHFKKMAKNESSLRNGMKTIILWF